MRAVWSYWSKPFRDQHGCPWTSPTHHLLSWVLSLQVARPHFETTMLVTDAEGARLLIDGLGLPFDHVSTELDSLHNLDSRWWVLGKLLAYSMQEQPFVHIDNDVYLWEPLPPRILTADILGQNLERFEFDRDSWYKPQRLNQFIQRANGWVPKEWAWYAGERGETAVCCGIFGGQNIDFVRQYADTALEFATHPRNASAWLELRDLADHCVLLEQYLLNAMLTYHNRHASESTQVELRCLFDSVSDGVVVGAHSDAMGSQSEFVGVGYTHLMGSLKKNPRTADQLERIVRRDCPEHFDRCVKYAVT